MHFFSEGLAKIRSGNFDSTGFLESACGPAAGTFQSLLSDPDGSRLLCVSTTSQSPDGSNPVSRVDPEITLAVWGDFTDRCAGHYQFGDPVLEQGLVTRREELARSIQAARNNADSSLDPGRLESQRVELEQEIVALRGQSRLARELLESHVEELEDWLAANRVELIGHYSTSGRDHQFLRDGSTGSHIAQDVESIRKQVEETRLKRRKKVREWSGEVKAIWDSLEMSMNGLAVNVQRSKAPVVLHRPHDQPGSAIYWVNAIIPWFDLAVGSLLVLGLFPRLAALAGGLFLASVIATQPPWIPGATPTWYQTVEMLALFVFASGMASVVPGLGWLVSGKRKQKSTSGAVAVPVQAGS